MADYVSDDDEGAPSQAIPTGPAPGAGLPPPSDESAWETTLAGAIPAIVSISFATTVPFSTYRAGASHATGFVVDAVKGLILTNAHVVRPGPVIAYASFSNYEEIELCPLYRDPVHDFGFFAFDPSALKFLDPLPAIPLAPDLARVGIPIRVVGNDAAEKLSILHSTLARLDRPAPFYGSSAANDFNTFYYQAASGTSGGSSGSPVLDRSGAAIALNAGGKSSAASSFYLPLDRPARALALLAAGKSVPRGTLTTVFAHKHYDELRRLGLSPDDEAAARATFPSGNGLLVVSKVLAGSASEAAGLAVGDIVWTLNGVPLNEFLTLEAVLDESVGNKVSLAVRRGGELVELCLPVVDLHAITPAEYVSFSAGIFHAVPYHIALNRSIPLEGVYVCSAGHALGSGGFAAGSVITAINGTPVPDLDTFEAQLAGFADGTKVTLHAFNVADPSRNVVAIAIIDRKWFPMARHVRNDATGVWDTVLSPPAPAPVPRAPQSTPLLDAGTSRIAAALAPSLVVVRMAIPHMIDGVVSSRFIGAGLIVDAARGLVVVDRGTVPISLGDVRISFANSFDVPANVLFLHPIHNFAIVQYEPSLVGSTPVASATLSSTPLTAGAATHFVGLNADETLITRASSVTKVAKFGMRRSKAPAFRQINIETVRLDLTLSSIGGVLVDDDGAVQAFWAAFLAKPSKTVAESAGGIPVTSVLAPFLDVYLSRPILTEPVPANTAHVQLWTVSLRGARAYGLTQAWVDTLAAISRSHEALKVEQVAFSSPAADALAAGDIVLAVDGTPVATFAGFAAAIATAPSVSLTLWRGGSQIEVPMETTPLVSDERARFVYWQGALLQPSFLELQLYQKDMPRGVYVARLHAGSSAHLWRLVSKTWIVAINNVPTPDLDACLAVLRTLKTGESARLHTVSLRGKTVVVTLRINNEYWPTVEWLRNGLEWERRVVEPLNE
ncbi:Pro-apoptotic serine protease nma111 [Thecamonas trahens ATCC 50062]|uniref:Pro-apoptotic serine protease nma111 n=1 Tax=Thecamonas trahens ATCC 50062 TaxID=461836 RepID=A0A0L0DUA8_THETB|nr:Pro-apoptotic serine protease nma111 [Thecamonas trahens ATCC 50062]KNC55914.1 Pro-apoptotic serine protease nma111 [Thecamonas trahens ATCC 50062]|eukprot:XP_013752732.1 Pro-apoptotic serine protease nma111 [Thecamonas trahens ATCC 50062]